ncbi:MAG: ribosomal protein S18-alanine N-acetyltransferase [Gammaproteobacteria bacterium]|nr:ribosomal protein S18-alanine N-acetyltransferase [Gammaproteobacteria bacterium]
MTLPGFQFKLLTLNDLIQIMAIERQASTAARWSASVMRDSLLAAHTQVWGIASEDSDELFAFGVISVVIDEAELLSLSVAPTYYRQGYGEKLLNHLIHIAKSKKAQMLYLEVRTSNQAALELYKKRGFQKMGMRKDYYETQVPNQKEDAILMSLSLL